MEENRRRNRRRRILHSDVFLFLFRHFSFAHTSMFFFLLKHLLLQKRISKIRIRIILFFTGSEEEKEVGDVDVEGDSEDEDLGDAPGEVCEK